MEYFLKQIVNNFPGLEGSPPGSYRDFSLKMSGVGLAQGEINHTYRLLINEKFAFFLKTNKAATFPGLFEKEKQGLEFLAGQRVITVPRVLYCGTYEDDQLLVLEWVHPGPKNDSFWKKFGEQLAQLHKCTHSHFGFTHNNYMGALPQENQATDSWVDFFIHHRLAPQIEMAITNSLLSKKETDSFNRLYKKLDTIFNEEKPSLLHGDLWSGNYMSNENSEPVLIDPAVYYGHRSIDLAMTTLFGGFDKTFYTAYHHHFPFPSNYQEQWDICNLYPLLIHLNLFGQSYLQNIIAILRKYA
jgi:protein-ribulosamine 3-kinase